MAQEIGAAWPSPEFEAVVRALVVERKEVDNKIAAAERRLELARKNAEVIELSGRDPRTEVAAIRTEITELERSKFGFRDKLWTAFTKERERYIPLRDALWTQVRNQDLAPLAARLNELLDEFERKTAHFTEFVASNNTVPGSSNAAQVASLDAGAAAWDSLVRESGVGANFFIGADKSLRNTVLDSITRDFRIHQRLEQTLNRLRAVLALQPLKTKAAWLQPEPTPTRQPLPPNHPAFWPADGMPRE
jgi:hypothetical protein